MRLMNFLRLLLVVFVSAAFSGESRDVAAAATAPPRYRLTDLGGPETQLGYANAINNAGVVVGEAIITSGQGLTAFAYHNGVLTSLGTLGGSISDARGLSNAGHIAGVSETEGLRRETAFVYSNGVLTGLNVFNGKDCRGMDVNDSGHVVGDFDYTSTRNHAFLYKDGRMTDLGSLAGPSGASTARAINNVGQITGSSAIAGGGSHAFLYSNGVMTDLNPLGGPSTGFDINDKGEVVGESNVVGGLRHAFLYSNGVVTDLGNSLGGSYASARSINALAQIVGEASTPGNVNVRGFLHSNGVMHDLNLLVDESGTGWTITRGTGINDSGWISAIGTFEGSLTRPLLLTPIPEPSTGGMVVVASFSIAARRSRIAWGRRCAVVRCGWRMGGWR